MNKRNFLAHLSIFFVLLLVAPAFAQKPSPTPTPADDNDVVKITTKIVQFDLIVVDKTGEQVRGLTRDDFELLQDGKPQSITSFSYVDRAVSVKNVLPAAAVPGSVPPPQHLSAADAGRIITFIVDDGNCSASMVGISASRAGIEKFVREQMLPNDLVAIYQTRNGSSTFQQYTNDRSLLLTAARRIRWLPPFGACENYDGSFFAANKVSDVKGAEPTDNERKIRENMEDATKDAQVVGALGVVRYVVQGLKQVPGRKIVFFMSDGFAMRNRNGQTADSERSLRELTDLANRSSVVINTVDDRGLFDPNLIEARDEMLAKNDIDATTKVGNDRAKQVRDSREGLAFLADETGGSFYRNQNDLDRPVREALKSEKGYYLLAYEPDEDSFKSKKFNRIAIRVKRPDLKVVSRSGFLGHPDETVKIKHRNEDSELYDAIVSPLPSPGLNVRLSAFFANSAAAGNFVRVLFHLTGDQITFTDDAGGTKKAAIDVVAVTMNEKNEVVDEFNRAHTVKFDAARTDAVRSNGLVYTADVPIKKPGTYTFRVAVRDGASRNIGSASQVIEIPDLKRPGLVLAGMTMAAVGPDGKFEMPAASNAQNAIVSPSSSTVPAVRIFRRGTVVAYAYSIYNAALDRQTGEPRLTVKLNLYKDGVLVSDGKPQPADLQKQADWTRISDFGYLRLRPEMQPGEYALQIIVKDEISGKSRNGSQWIDFEVVE